MILKVKKVDVADHLMKDFGFKFVATDIEDYLYVEPPETMSNTKARKLLTILIKMSLAKDDLFKAKNKYNKLVEEINKIASE